MNAYTENGLIFTKRENGAYFSVRAANNNIRSANIPQYFMDIPVKIIDENAFCGCSRLEEISIPDSITDVGLDAFSGCRSVKRVRVQSLSAWCGITFWNSQSSPLAFADNAVLYVNNSPLTEAALPDGIKEVKNYAFCGCTSLQSVVIKSYVTFIGHEAFLGCSSLESIVIPESVTYIGTLAFCECKSLSRISIPVGVAEIKDLTFCGCTSLELVSLPDGIEYIGNRAFYECPSLKSIVLPKYLHSIGNEAFAKCASLTYPDIPKGVNSIGINAFTR